MLLNLQNLIPFFQAILLLITFVIGIIKNKENILLIFIFLEIGLLSVSLIFIFGSTLIFNLNFGQILSLFVLTLAACESCIGLSLLIVFFKLKGSTATLKLNSLIG